MALNELLFNSMVCLKVFGNLITPIPQKLNYLSPHHDDILDSGFYISDRYDEKKPHFYQPSIAQSTVFFSLEFIKKHSKEWDSALHIINNIGVGLLGRIFFLKDSIEGVIHIAFGVSTLALRLFAVVLTLGLNNKAKEQLKHSWFQFTSTLISTSLAFLGIIAAEKIHLLHGKLMDHLKGKPKNSQVPSNKVDIAAQPSERNDSTNDPSKYIYHETLKAIYKVKKEDLFSFLPKEEQELILAGLQEALTSLMKITLEKKPSFLSKLIERLDELALLSFTIIHSRDKHYSEDPSPLTEKLLDYLGSSLITYFDENLEGFQSPKEFESFMISVLSIARTAYINILCFQTMKDRALSVPDFEEYVSLGEEIISFVLSSYKKLPRNINLQLNDSLSHIATLISQIKQLSETNKAELMKNELYRVKTEFLETSLQLENWLKEDESEDSITIIEN